MSKGLIKKKKKKSDLKTPSTGKKGSDFSPLLLFFHLELELIFILSVNVLTFLSKTSRH